MKEKAAPEVHARRARCGGDPLRPGPEHPDPGRSGKPAGHRRRKRGELGAGTACSVMEEAVDSLASGDRMLVDQGALRQFSLLQQDPEALPDEFTTDDSQTVIQLMALARIGRRFDLKTVARGSDGLRWSSWCPGVQAMNLREGRIRARCRIRRNPAPGSSQPMETTPVLKPTGNISSK